LICFLIAAILSLTAASNSQAQPFLTAVGGIAGNDPNNGGAVYFISVQFSDPPPGPGTMDISSGGNGMAFPDNYSVGGSAVFSAQVQPDGLSVLLEVPATDVTSPPNFTVTVMNVQDANGSIIVTTNLNGTLNTAFGSTDIGTQPVPTGTFILGNQINLTGGGAISVGGGNSPTNDQFHFVYEQVTGDFDRKVQITSITNNNPGVADANVRGGLVCLASLNPGVQEVNVFATWPGGGNKVQEYCRYATDPTELAVHNEFTDNLLSHFAPALGGVGAALPNQWLRLKRVGNDFIVYVGTNGVNWTKAGEKYFPNTSYSPGFPSTLYVGMFAAASVSGAVSITSFQNYGDATPADTTKPVLLSAGTIDQVNVGLKFSKYLDSASASQTGNYVLSQGTVTAAEVGFSGQSVFLTVSGLTDNNFTVTASGVKDDSGNTMAPTTVSASYSSAWQAQDTGQFATTNIDTCWSNMLSAMLVFTNGIPGTNGATEAGGITGGYIPGTANRPQYGDDPWQIGKSVAVSSGDVIGIETFGGGCNLWNNADNGQFVYRSLTGDFDVQVSVDRIDRAIATQGYGAGCLVAKAGLYVAGGPNACGDTSNTNLWTASGSEVMDQQNCTSEPDSTGGSAFREYRSGNKTGYSDGNAVGTGTKINGISGFFGKQGLVATDAKGDVSPNSSPTQTRWLRLARGTNTFFFYYSYDGQTWVQFDKGTASMGSTVLVGWQMFGDNTGTLYPGSPIRQFNYPAGNASARFYTNWPSSFVTATLSSFGDYRPKLTASTDASGNVLVKWGPSILGTLQSTTSLGGTPTWTDVTDAGGRLVTGAYNGGANNAGPNSYTNPAPVTGTLFYRLRY